MSSKKTKSVLLLSKVPVSAIDRLDFILLSVDKFEPDTVQPTEKSICSVRKLIDRYTITLGYDSVTLIGTIVTLLTKGKIRVEFRSFSERLSLFDLGDLMDQSEAMDLYAGFLALKPKETKAPSGFYTQNLMVQLPQVPHYTGPAPKIK